MNEYMYLAAFNDIIYFQFTQIANNLEDDALSDDTPADLQAKLWAQDLAIQLALEIFILSLE